MFVVQHTFSFFSHSALNGHAKNYLSLKKRLLQMCYETPSICQTKLKIHTLLHNLPGQCPMLVTIHDVLEKKNANAIGLLHEVDFF